jgi:hypothetical protein
MTDALLFANVAHIKSEPPSVAPVRVQPMDPLHLADGRRPQYLGTVAHVVAQVESRESGQIFHGGGEIRRGRFHL